MKWMKKQCALLGVALTSLSSAAELAGGGGIFTWARLPELLAGFLGTCDLTFTFRPDIS